MSNLSRIPKHLLYSEKHDQFLNWLYSQVIPWMTTRDILQTWSHYTEYKIEAAEWTLLENRWVKLRARL